MQNETSNPTNPSIPHTPALIGPAKLLQAPILSSVNDLMKVAIAKGLHKTNGHSTNLLFHGQSGVGKSSIVNSICSMVKPKYNSPINGRDATIDFVRNWKTEAMYYPQEPSGLVLKVINEIDEIQVAAQSLLLSFLEEAPDNWIFLATTNETMDSTQRFWSRWEFFFVERPTDEEICAHISQRYGLDTKTALAIALEAKGNVRTAENKAKALMRLRKT